MKAVICHEPFDLRLIDRPPPRPGTGDVLVRIRRVGLCGTDYHIYDGSQPYLSYPRIMGHELGGEVVEVPEGSRFAIGQIVTINPYLPCGACVACAKGRPNCCANVRVLGVHTDGGMVEYLAVPEAAVIDAAGLSLDQAAMVEFLAIGAHAVARARLRAGDRALIVGAGPIGVATALFAKLDGARVTMVDTRQARLDYARDAIGIGHTIASGPGLPTALAEHTDGAMFDCVFDASGNIHAMRAGLDYVANAGSYVLISVVQGNLVFADPEFHRRETTLLASRNALSADFDRVIDAIRTGLIPTAALQTHAFEANEMVNRMPALIEDADHVLKAIACF